MRQDIEEQIIVKLAGDNMVIRSDGAQGETQGQQQPVDGAHLVH